jgi:hypothetical protein
MTNQEIIDNLYEALNGLSIGWQMTNLKDEAKRQHLQAPVNAAIAAVSQVIAEFENGRAR